MEEIVKVHHPKVKKKLVKEALEIFFDIRKVPGMKKKPSTSELIDWLKLLMADDIPDEIFKNRDPYTNLSVVNRASDNIYTGYGLTRIINGYGLIVDALRYGLSKGKEAYR